MAARDNKTYAIIRGFQEQPFFWAFYDGRRENFFRLGIPKKRSPPLFHTWIPEIKNISNSFLHRHLPELDLGILPSKKYFLNAIATPQADRTDPIAQFRHSVQLWYNRASITVQPMPDTALAPIATPTLLDDFLMMTGLDLGAIAIRISKGANETEHAAEIRMKRWRDGQPPRLNTLERDLSLFGLRLKIDRIDTEETDIDRLKASYHNWEQQSRSPITQRSASLILRNKARSLLEEIRDLLADELREPWPEEIAWWRSVLHVGNADWWREYYRVQAIAAQAKTEAGWRAIGRARYAIAVMVLLEIQGES